MLANMLYNPQIERIAVTGVDTVKSGKALENFFNGGVEPIDEEGIRYLRIIGSPSFPLDIQLFPSRFHKLEIKRFRNEDLEELLNFVNQPPKRSFTESNRQLIELSVPKFSDYPSEISLPKIIVSRPLEAYMEALYHLDRFGTNINLDSLSHKGKRRTLSSLDIVITDPVFENEETLRKFNFDPVLLREYQKEILSQELPEKQPYGYGHRLRTYFTIDQLEEIIKRLKSNKLDRHSLALTWDPKKDLSQEKDSSSPCLTDIYFKLNKDEKLMLSASFRTHNIVSAYLTNIYGLIAIQDYVSQQSEIPKGQIEIKSRWPSIDPDNTKTKTALEMVKKYRKVQLNVKDPRGYMTVNVENDQIVLQHFSQGNQLLDEYRSENALEIKNMLRNSRTISNPDHAMWIGYNLAMAEQKLKGEIKEL